MKPSIFTAVWLPAALLCPGCSDTADSGPHPRAIEFSTPERLADGGTRSGANDLFEKGDGIGVFACYSQNPDGETPFVANFMRNQLVSYDGAAWTYSPLKYWPTDGSLEFYAYFPYDADQKGVNEVVRHKCLTGLEPMYGAHTSVTAEHGVLSGDGINEDRRLRLIFSPMLNKINFTAKAQKGLFEEPGTGFTDYRFLIKEFRIWGFYREALCNTADATWTDHITPYTRENPLDMTAALRMQDTESVIPGYRYEPGAGYRTDRAIVLLADDGAFDMFGKSVHLIPMDGIIAGNDPGFEIVYVVLTNEPGKTEYKESGTVTRAGSLRDVFVGKKGLIKKFINVHLEFTVDGVTVTRELHDYEYKPMF